MMKQDTLEGIVDYCINMGMAYMSEQIELAEARGFVKRAIEDYIEEADK